MLGASSARFPEECRVDVSLRIDFNFSVQEGNIVVLRGRVVNCQFDEIVHVLLFDEVA